MPTRQEIDDDSSRFMANVLERFRHSLCAWVCGQTILPDHVWGGRSVRIEFSILGSHIREPGDDEEPSVHATEFAAEYSKRITPRCFTRRGVP